MVKRTLRIMLFGLIGLVVLCFGFVGLVLWSNRRLPSRSAVTTHLSQLDKAHLVEALHLQQALGDQVWPGWGQQDIPLILYNEDYAFLVGYPNPPDGWKKVPQYEQRGGSWEPVPGDDLAGKVYYRQALLDEAITPEAFTVLIGERWVASLGTREHSEIRFYSSFHEELPDPLKSIFPYQIAWNLVMGDTETYIGALEHEVFHAFQGARAADRLEAAENANHFEGSYPWEKTDLAERWGQEMDLLVQAVRAGSESEAEELARKFLAQRADRRVFLDLSPELVDYERQREWLEGLAKYAELEIQRLAGEKPDYKAAAGLESDPDFKAYTTRERFWSAQINEARRTAGRKGETRFYYSGFVQAVLLDRLAPGWKELAFEPGIMLEDLLAEALKLP